MTVLNEHIAAVAREMSLNSQYIVITSFKRSISATVLDDLTEIPSTTVIPYPNGIQLRVVSSSANDSASGTGIRTIMLEYLDIDYQYLIETITLNGATPVNSVATNIQRVLCIHAATVGSAMVSVGNISLTNVAGTVTYDYITAGGNQSLTGHFTVPGDRIGFITGWQASSTKQSVSLRLRATRDKFTGQRIPSVFLFQDIVNLADSSSGLIRFTSFLKCEPKTDIKMSAISTTASPADASGSFGIILVPKYE